eukprot:symbB.v1.2.035473.t1/scaffold4784.1/size34903/1
MSNDGRPMDGELGTRSPRSRSPKHLRRRATPNAVQETVRCYSLSGGVLAEVSLDCPASFAGLRAALREKAPVETNQSLRFFAVDGGELEEHSQVQVPSEVTVVISNREWIITGCTDGSAATWDANTGEWCTSLFGHDLSVFSVALSPDHLSIATGSSDHTIRLWSVQKQRWRLTLRGHRSGVLCVNFSSDGRHLVSASSDRTARVWSAGSFGECISVLRGHRKDVSWAAFSPDSTEILTGSDDRTLIFWDANTYARSQTLGGHPDRINCVGYACDGRHVALAFRTKDVSVWKVERHGAQGSELLQRLQHKSAAFAASWHPEKLELAVALADGTTILWNALAGEQLVTLDGHGGKLWLTNSGLFCKFLNGWLAVSYFLSRRNSKSVELQDLSMPAVAGGTHCCRECRLFRAALPCDRGTKTFDRRDTVEASGNSALHVVEELKPRIPPGTRRRPMLLRWFYRLAAWSLIQWTSFALDPNCLKDGRKKAALMETLQHMNRFTTLTVGKCKNVTHDVYQRFSGYAARHRRALFCEEVLAVLETLQETALGRICGNQVDGDLSISRMQKLLVELTLMLQDLNAFGDGYILEVVEQHLGVMAGTVQNAGPTLASVAVTAADTLVQLVHHIFEQLSDAITYNVAKLGLGGAENQTKHLIRFLTRTPSDISGRQQTAVVMSMATDLEEAQCRNALYKLPCEQRMAAAERHPHWPRMTWQEKLRAAKGAGTSPSSQPPIEFTRSMPDLDGGFRRRITPQTPMSVLPGASLEARVASHLAAARPPPPAGPSLPALPPKSAVSTLAGPNAAQQEWLKLIFETNDGLKEAMGHHREERGPGVVLLHQLRLFFEWFKKDCVPASQQAGYEPKIHATVKSEAMATKRGASLPASGIGNPFWSQRTKEEWQLRAVRPADLPVPEDEETQRQLEQEVEFPALEEGETSRGRTRRSSRVTSPRRAAGVFRTPQSWETGKGVGSVGLRTSGMMPMEEEERSVNPVPQGVDEGSDPSEQSLQRALEKEVVTQLHEENMRLKQMLSRMQQSKGTGTTSTSEWSEVSGEKEETGRSFLPQTEEKKERIMFTPNGTRVPSQPPPVDRVATWKCLSYHHGRWIYGRTMRKKLVIEDGSRDLVENRTDHQESYMTFHLSILVNGEKEVKKELGLEVQDDIKIYQNFLAVIWSPLVLGDWLEVIAPIMKDVSPQAHRWWPLVEAEARHYYETWRQSTPVERLYVRPRCKVVEEDPSLQRTEQRGISLLIKAVPESVKETIVSERMMTSTGIIFTLMINFQPGGANERSMLLTTLTQPSWGTSVKEATATMRTWRRFHKRTTEIGAALPDATVLMKALEEPMQLVSKTDAQAIFRLSQARAMLEVDSKPTMVAVWNFSECLLAELESLMLVSGLEAGTKEPSV